jgi:hypothetical protein
MGNHLFAIVHIAGEVTVCPIAVGSSTVSLLDCS